jgi:hypothetical protein
MVTAAAVTLVALATQAMTRVSATPVRARTAATSAAAPTAVAMLTTEAAMVEAAAMAEIIATTQPALPIQAITAMWVVRVKARMAATSAVAHKGAVTPVTKGTMVATAVTAEAAMAAATVGERNSPRSFETAGPSGPACPLDSTS